MSLSVYLYTEIDLGGEELYRVELFDLNITHNLSKMAKEADLYEALWGAEENKFYFASEIVPSLERGLTILLENPNYFKQFNPVNSWGNYDNLVDFVTDYLEACETYPKANIEVSR